MPKYWLDANVLIEANNRSYPIRIARTFWMRLAEQVELGNVVCPRRVYQEVAEQEQHQDEVAEWMKVREQWLRVIGSAEVQRQVGEIEEYIYSRYPQWGWAESWQFCKGGDPWVIAHAKVDGGIVVTQETRLAPEARKPRIPDVCKHYDVSCVDLLKMLELLGVTF